MTVTPVAPDPQLAEDALSIANMLDEVLVRIVAGFERAGVDLPDRQFWTTGTPTADCEQLVVSFRQVYVGPPGDEAAMPQPCDGPRSANLEIRITRCITTPKGTRPTTPKAEDIEAGARKQVVDAWLLLDFAPDLDTWNGLGPGGPGVIATVDAGEPQGAYQTTLMTITMQVP